MATTAKKKTAKKKATSRKTAKPSEGWLDKDNPNEEEAAVQARTRKKAKATAKKAPKKKTPAKKAPAKRKSDDDGEEGEGQVHNVVPPKYREQYKEHNSSCGDDVAEVFKKACADVEDLPAKLAEIGDANDVDVASRWGHLNNGMQRMNLGNVLRARVKNGKRVVIGSKVWKEKKA